MAVFHIRKKLLIIVNNIIFFNEINVIELFFIKHKINNLIKIIGHNCTQFNHIVCQPIITLKGNMIIFKVK